jgi:hypothetical protein
MRNEDITEVLSGLRGKKIQVVRRILYIPQSSIDSSEGPIEIHLTDGYTVLLDGGSDGESLIVKSRPGAIVSLSRCPRRTENLLSNLENGQVLTSLKSRLTRS